MARKGAPNKAKSSALMIKLDEDDFKMAGANLQQVAAMSLEDRVQHIRQVLTDVVAGEMLKITPHGFNLKTLTFSFELSGKPGGVGVTGTVGVTFEKQ